MLLLHSRLNLGPDVPLDHCGFARPVLCVAVHVERHPHRAMPELIPHRFRLDAKRTSDGQGRGTGAERSAGLKTRNRVSVLTRVARHRNPGNGLSWIQVLVGATPWRFKSSLAHQAVRKLRGGTERGAG